MARAIHRLTARQVAALREPGRYPDGGNLFVVIGPSGGRNWSLRYVIGGKSREMGLGPATPDGVSLAEARERAAEARRLLAQGVDPLEQKRASETAQKAASTTFGTFADQYIRDQRSGWANPKHAAQWEMTLGDAYCRSIRRLPITEVGVEHVLAVLSPHWQRVPETARRVRMRLEKVLDAAKVRGLRIGENPARWKGNLDHLLPRQTTKKAHHAALPFTEVPAFIGSLRARDKGTAALALELTILTAARSGEALGARWEEFDLEAKVWTIPQERMKARRPHRVPLSPAALDVLNIAKGRDDVWVFPGQKPGKPLSNMAMEMQLRRMDRDDITVHGFRSSFRDWAAETTAFPREVCEMALAHVIESDTEAAYRRGDLFEKRRKLMDAWAAFVTREPTVNVVRLRG
jgi:integrase